MYIIPQFINKSLKYFGFEVDEMAIIYMSCSLSFLAKSFLVFVILIGASFYLVRKKRQCPPGYLKHMLYFLSLYSLEKYPDYTEQDFLE